ncbi:MAG TPA: peptide chain release factor N(5)-glutamine methyltransferase [Gemmatimonadaceae bacterium]|nr:peptide chain release factor N(5)-glutamine methyltransferase [Gemmatimonadaceae bacterium]
MAEEAERVAAPAEGTLGALAEAVAAVLLPVAGSDGDASREARELLAAMHDMPRHWVVVERGTAMTDADWVRALRAAERRAAGAPLQYAAGRASFRHLTLDVDERVLIPRPETEQLVEIVLDATAEERGGIAVDVGTGSGAIALALASEGRFARVIGTDISSDALDVARGNLTRCASSLRAPVELRGGSLLRPVLERPLRAVVSNPPYISTGEAGKLPASVRDWEPAVALFSGADGMSATARLVRESAAALGAGGLLALEVDARRASIAAELVATHGEYEQVRVLLDLTGRERFVVARRREGVE